MEDSHAIHLKSQLYRFGHRGLTKNPHKAFKLCFRATELDNSDACACASIFYCDVGEGVVEQQDMTEAKEYSKRLVKNGHIIDRYNLGVMEAEKGNFCVALRHCLLSAAAGDRGSLTFIAQFHRYKYVTRKEYATALAS